jgi:polar amino acid transport system substrate-binding protein
MNRWIALALVFITAGCVTRDVPPRAAVSELAPTGKLRAAINYGNPVLAQRAPAAGGVSVDLSRELARRLRVPLEMIPYDAAGKVTADATTGAWDIAFVARDPGRARDIDFTAAYVIIEGGYLVRQDSPLKAIDDVDRDGIRIAVGRGSAYDLYLGRSLKHAQLVRSPTSPAVIDLFLEQKLDVAAGVKQQLQLFAASRPGLRVMDGRFMVIEQAMATPRGRPAGKRYLDEFISEMKSTGFVAASLDKSGQRDASVAP